MARFRSDLAREKNDGWVLISKLFTDVCIKGTLLSTILGTCEIKEIDLRVEKIPQQIVLLGNTGFLEGY